MTRVGPQQKNIPQVTGKSAGDLDIGDTRKLDTEPEMKLPPLPTEREETTLVAMVQAPGPQAEEADRATTLHKKVEVLASTKQHEIAKIHIKDQGTKQESYISRYTEELCNLLSKGLADSLGAAHDKVAEIAAASPKTHPFSPTRTKQKKQGRWTRSTETIPERGALIIRGGTLGHPDYPAFTADVKLMQKTAIEALGVDKNKAYVLYGANLDRIEDILGRLAAGDTKQLLVYYTGHGMIDAKGVSLKRNDGSVHIDDWSKHLADTKPDDPTKLRIRGTKSDVQGGDKGALFVNDNRATRGEDGFMVLHEERLYAMLNKMAKEHGMTVKLVLDTDHASAFIPEGRR